VGGDLVRKAGSRVRRRLARLRHPKPSPTAGSRLLEAFARANPRAFFVEIGANDGQHHDHLRPHIVGRQWAGILVEPVPHIFRKLVRNYDGFARLILENVAIAAEDGELPFYYLSEPDAGEEARLPDWYDGIGSFSRDTLLTHTKDIPDLAERLVTEKVPTLTFDSLCARHGVSEVDLLIVDTEGYDWEIVKSIDFARWRPQLVIYEHFHLSPEARVACADRMQEHGYETLEEALDTFCLAPDAHRRVRSVWKRLEPTFPGVSKSDELE
jgi:FkbM family methyltransferase